MIYSKKSIGEAYKRVRREGIEHEQSVRAVAQAFIISVEEAEDAVQQAVVELAAESANETQPA